MDHSQSCVDLCTSFVQCSKYDEDKRRRKEDGGRGGNWGRRVDCWGKLPNV